jgi:hypothetical protein
MLERFARGAGSSLGLSQLRLHLCERDPSACPRGEPIGERHRGLGDVERTSPRFGRRRVSSGTERAPRVAQRIACGIGSAIVLDRIGPPFELSGAILRVRAGRQEQEHRNRSEHVSG